MAPTRSSTTGPTKHITMHHFMKQQHLLRQRLKPAVLWTWPAAAAPGEAAADDLDGMMGGAWPPRSYTCAFCRREFRSAQALGGHMNVHRRDRAKMRGGQYSAAAQLGLVGSTAAAEAPTGNIAAAGYTVLYPILNSDALAAAAHERRQCHGSNDENGKEIDLELRLGWP